jgi:hypothetical protein
MLRALVVAASMLAVSACAGSGDDGDGSGWRRTVAPANGLSGLDAVRVGGKVVVVGGADYDQSRVKAIVLDLDSGRWSRAARSPLPWRAGHSVVAADGRVIVWGGTPGLGAAAYHPSRDTWRRIPRSPLDRRYGHSAVWTGHEMIVWGGWHGRGPRASGAAYDPRTRRWRRMAAAPLSARLDHAAVWTGDEMIVWGGSQPAGGGRDRVLADGAAYEPRTDTWRRLAPSPLRSAPSRTLGTGLEVDLDAAWTGTRMLVWNGIAGAAYEPRRNAWKPFAPPPPQPWLPEDTAVWTGDELMVFGGARAVAYDPTTRRWTALPRAPILRRDRHAAVWTGEAMLVWGGCCRGTRHHRDGALYSPR